MVPSVRCRRRIAAFLLAGLAACERGHPAALQPIEITLLPSTTAIALGLSAQLEAKARYGDGAYELVTDVVAWSSNAPDVLAIDEAAGRHGVVASRSPGSATITAMWPGSRLRGTAVVHVMPAELQSLAITPGNPAIARGTTRAFVATGTFSDHSVQDLTTVVTWSSSATAVATIDPGGLAAGIGIGSTTIAATSDDGVVGTATLTVTAAVLTSLDVTPTNPSIALGTAQQFVAMGTFSDSTVQDLSPSVAWSSSASTVAAIDNVGLANSAAVGTTTITASDPGTGVFGTTTLTVTAAVLVSLAVTPTAPSIALGTTQQFAATGSYSDSTTQDLTTAVTWSSSATATATISNAGGSEGLASSAATGTTTITATHVGSGLFDSTTLTVTPVVLVSLAVTPATPSIALGTAQQFAATGTYSDSTTQDLTTAVTWSSSAAATATISNAGGSEGLASSVASGTATITATHAGSGIVGSTTLTVTPAVLVSLAVTPASPNVLVGSTRQFAATGTYSDSTTQDLTTAVTWSSSVTANATVSNAGGSVGLATGVAAGSTSITATHAGSGIFDTTTLTVYANITLRAASQAAQPSGTTTLTIATPTGTAADDVLVAAIAVRPETATITAPSGWTLVRRLDNSGGAANSLAVYRRVAVVGEASNHTWTFSTSTGSAGGILAFVGVDTGNPIDVENGQTTASSTSHTTPSVTTTVAGTMLVAAFGFSSSATWTPPAGMTEAVDVASITPPTATGIALCVDYVLQPTAAATGTRTAVASNDADTGNAAILALRRTP